MGLAQVKNYSYGIDGKTLDLTIAIPTGSYLRHFWIANQNDIQADNSTKAGIEYIEAIRSTEPDMDAEKAFKKLFRYIGDFTCKETGNKYDLYQLNPSSDTRIPTPNGVSTGIGISQNDLTFITMEVSYQNDYTPYGVTQKYQASNKNESGEDITVFPMYNLLAIRLRALSYAKFINCSCEMPRDFIDKILQIKAIELANSGQDYYKASVYWNKFYKGKNIVTNKRCDCHV